MSRFFATVAGALVFACLTTAHAEPALIATVTALQDDNFPAILILPDETTLFKSDILPFINGLSGNEVIIFDVSTATLNRYLDTSLSQVLANRGASLSYLSAYDASRHAFYRPHVNQLSSGILDATGAYLIVNASPFVSPAINLHELDTDGDSVSDFDELNRDGDPGNYTAGVDTDPGTGPNTSIDPAVTDPKDTDGDGFTDGEEDAANSNPVDPNSVPSIADGDLAPWGAPDGVINTADVLIAIQLAITNRAPGGLQYAHGDMNLDGVINIVDVLLIQKIVLP